MKRLALSFAVVLLLFSSHLQAADEEALMLVQRAFDYWRGLSSYSEFSMTIQRPDFQRTMVLRGWTKGP